VENILPKLVLNILAFSLHNLMVYPELLISTMTPTTFSERSVEHQIIDRQGYFLKINPLSELTEFVIKADVIFDEILVRDSKNILEQIRPGHKHYLLVSSDGFFRLTRKARKIGASKDFSTHLAAVGCYTSNFSLALLGELYNKINKPAVPTRVFNSKEIATEWLEEQMAKIKAA
jgi:hypothetical protein